MRQNRRSASRAVLIGSVIITLAACGSDGGSADDVAERENSAAPSSQPASTPSVSPNVPSAGGSDADPTGGVVDAVGAADALDSVGIGALASALESATKAERVEVVDDTIHLYLGDASRVRGEAACIVTGAILGDGQFAVIHDEGTEHAC